MTELRQFAAAKINLALHVTGTDARGYHLLDSLVCFADVGDIVTVAPSPSAEFSITGPMADALGAGEDNLVIRAARLLDPLATARITLEKNLPVASGIGGGSADAAACLRALCLLWQRAMPDRDALLSLGADVPVCIAGQSARMQGIGAEISPLPDLPLLDAVLVNPGAALSTPEVFRALQKKNNPPLPDLPKGAGWADWMDFLRATRNDLAAPAAALNAEIGVVLTMLRATNGCALARMSGSGATCFAIYESGAQAQAAAKEIAKRWPDWWVVPARLGGRPISPAPRRNPQDR